ncbi:MAG: NADPH-dependent F420 reductase [Steroidobacteraceae bacterium]
MTIAILGAGNVGAALGRRLTSLGEDVCFGVPDPEKYRALAKELGQHAKVGRLADAVAASTIVILAVPYAAAEPIARSIDDWAGKILIDATNPLAPGLAGLVVGTTTSGAEEIARSARNARVVKAFNTTGAENMVDPVYPTGRIFMPICGDDPAARAEVVALAGRIGFEAFDCGELSAARYLEPFAMTWIHMAYKRGLGRRFGFGFMRR